MICCSILFCKTNKFTCYYDELRWAPTTIESGLFYLSYFQYWYLYTLRQSFNYLEFEIFRCRHWTTMTWQEKQFSSFSTLITLLTCKTFLIENFSIQRKLGSEAKWHDSRSMHIYSIEKRSVLSTRLYTRVLVQLVPFHLF